MQPRRIGHIRFYDGASLSKGELGVAQRYFVRSTQRGQRRAQLMTGITNELCLGVHIGADRPHGVLREEIAHHTANCQRREIHEHQLSDQLLPRLSRSPLKEAIDGMVGKMKFLLSASLTRWALPLQLRSRRLIKH